jgi:hypothetical protein
LVDTKVAKLNAQFQTVLRTRLHAAVGVAGITEQRAEQCNSVEL